jgi:arylsulfatase A-like enzyme
MKSFYAILLLTLPLLVQATPNVIVIMADDLGPGDIGFYHRERTGERELIPTPNMDRMIAEGIRFTRAHSPASLCAPSRFSMLSGNFPFRNYSPFGAWSPSNRTGIDPKYTTSARIAKAAGYQTAFFGKWGLGGQMYVNGSDKIKKGWGKDDIDYTRRAKGPNQYGFDYALELPQGIQNEPFAYYENGEWMKLKPDSELVPLGPKQSMYDISRKHKDMVAIGDSNWDPRDAGKILASKAVEFIENHKAEHPDKPFYIYYCSQAVHIPHTPPAQLNGVKIAGSTLGVHGDMVREFDVQIGMLRAALQANGYDKNTLLILTSDNGGLKADPAMSEQGHDSTNGLRAIKGSIHEGGHRIPFVAVWPGVIAPNQESDALIVGHDVVATLASVSGQRIDRSKVMDSQDLMPIFLQHKDAKGHDVIVHQSSVQEHANYAIQEDNWKLIMRAPNRKNLVGLESTALFNLANNPNENEDLNLLENPEYSRVQKRLFDRFLQIRESGEPTVRD